MRVDRHVAAHVAVVEGQSAALLDVVHRAPHQLEAPIVVVTAGQAVLVVDRREPPRVAAADHVVHFDQHLGILGVDSPGQIEIRADVVFLAIGHRMAVVGVVAAAVPPIAVEHQEDDAVGAVGQEPLLGRGQVLLRAEADLRIGRRNRPASPLDLFGERCRPRFRRSAWPRKSRFHPAAAHRSSRGLENIHPHPTGGCRRESDDLLSQYRFAAIFGDLVQFGRLRIGVVLRGRENPSVPWCRDRELAECSLLKRISDISYSAPRSISAQAGDFAATQLALLPYQPSLRCAV